MLRAGRAFSCLRIATFKTPTTFGIRSFCSEDKKNIIDDKFMDLLMSAGIDGDDIKTDDTNEQNVSAEDTLDFTFDDIPGDQTEYETEEDYTVPTSKKIQKIQQMIRKTYSPKASADMLSMLQDKSNWNDLSQKVHQQLGNTIRYDEDNEAVDLSDFDTNKAIHTVAQAFKNELRTHDPSDWESTTGDLMDKMLDGRKVGTLDLDLERKIKQVQHFAESAFDIEQAPRKNLSSKDAANISKEISKRSDAEKEALLAELYASDQEDEIDRVKKERNTEKSFYEKLKEKIELEGDSYIKEEEVRPTLAKFCKAPLRKWVQDASAALVGKGHYDIDGNWVQFNRIDLELNQESYDVASQDLTVPAYTFRVVGLPNDKTRTVKRAYIPPPCRTRIPSDLVGRYRFGITPEMVENMQLSEKIKKVISFAYASHTEIRRARLEDAIAKFGKRPNDSGHTAVQLCMLNQKVRHLEEHVAIHRKDQNAHRQLRLIVSKRRRLYKYLKRKDITTYYNVLKDQVLEDKFLMYKNE